VDGEKARVDIIPNQVSKSAALTEHANWMLLDKVLGVDEVVVDTWYDFQNFGYKARYACYKSSNGRQKMVCSMVFTDDVPIEDRVTALRVALRMSNGNDTEEQKGGTTTP